VKAALNSIAHSGFCQQGFLYGPAVPEPPSKQRFVQTMDFRPFRNAPTLALKLDKYVGLRVSLLSFDVCPSAVLGMVAKSAVDSVNRATYWALTHVRQKVLKGQPFLAHSHADGAVAMVLIVPWIGASADHIHPSDVCRGLLPARNVPMGLGVLQRLAGAFFGAVLAAPRIYYALSCRKNSTTVFARCLNLHAKIIQQDKQAGMVLRGLTIRRQAEYKQCMGGV